MEAQSLNHWTSREVPVVNHFEQSLQDIQGTLQLLVTEGESTPGVVHSGVQGPWSGLTIQLRCPNILYK